MGRPICYNTFTMDTINLTGLAPAVAKKILPFIEEILKARSSDMHSFHLVGSAVTPDYDERLSDINSVVVMNRMDLTFLSFLAPLGKKHGKKGIAAPLVMTPEYIRNSLDAFPLEFFDFELIHKTVYGGDVLKDIMIAKPSLRLQCEREIKIKLIGLRQGYLSSLGKKKHLAAVLVKSFTGSMPIFRAIIHLLGKEPPIPRPDVITSLSAATGLETDIFRTILALKYGRIKPSEHELRGMFETYYNAMEAIGKIIDELRA